MLISMPWQFISVSDNFRGHLDMTLLLWLIFLFIDWDVANELTFLIELEYPITYHASFFLFFQQLIICSLVNLPLFSSIASAPSTIFTLFWWFIFWWSGLLLSHEVVGSFRECTLLFEWGGSISGKAAHQTWHRRAVQQWEVIHVWES